MTILYNALSGLRMKTNIDAMNTITNLNGFRDAYIISLFKPEKNDIVN